jgi:ACS family tartrate transporter-like MFS transporter
MDLESRTIRRVTLRLVPFLIVCYFFSYLDRVNLGFAGLEMNKDLALSATAYGTGAGIFFLAYFALEVPSNLLLHRFGARKWIARIMLSWGIVSGMTAFIPEIAAATGLSNQTTFYVIRILLGAAEAGFFPGIIFYLTIWFPSIYRARVIGYFMAAIPLSGVFGSPLSGYLLGLDGVAGLRGWQWLFILEATPTLILAVATYFYLTDRPADAKWLMPEERAWLAARLEQEHRQRLAARRFTVPEALGDTRVLLLAFVYFGVVAGLYALGFFLPAIIKGLGMTNAQTGWLAAIPAALGTMGMVLWGRHSDRTGERKEHTALAALVAGLGLASSVVLDDPVGKVIALSIGGMGIYAALPVFWTLPTSFLTGAAAAGGIAIVNALGNLAGFAGPFVVGKIKDSTGGFAVGLLTVAGLAFLSMLVALSLAHDSRLERVMESGPGEEMPERRARKMPENVL